MSNILVCAGSTRKDSFNKRLAKCAANAAKSAGAEVTYFDLTEYPMPMYDGDLETAEGLPETVRKLKEIFKQHNGLIIASPEYNSSFSGVLKNTIDWVSRQEGQEPSLAVFKNKYALLLSASPGALGGLRGLVGLRSMLSNIQVTVVPDQLSISKAHEAFNENGELLDAKQLQQLNTMTLNFVNVLKKLDVK
ncbi:MAG: NAD(P)H-dependent oxidoreductase [bacterium]|nr:NAD(P)H-dependent oxidoreductase [bacterium]